MFGSYLGNISALIYFFIFQICGMVISISLFKKKINGFTILLGSAMGSFLLQWLPVLYSFPLQFTKTSHMFGLFTAILLAAAIALKTSQKANHSFSIPSIRKFFIENPVFLVLIPVYIWTVLVLQSHTIPYIDGAMHSGQSTYGDMNMHLGFITSIANQGIFPPEYSILPGTKLAYPFLSDTISSSLYLWGSSLRFAYLLPMYFALMQVFCGMYLIAKYSLQWLGGRYQLKSILAFLFFFLNGGFGFIYFINKGFHSENFTRIFTAFYETPTNYVDPGNIQWHNVLCDMLIPQRATLFGWAILFPLIVLLIHAVRNKSTLLFAVSGVLAGGLVLIHTHSFLALGILCFGYLLLHLFHQVHRGITIPTSVRIISVVLFFSGMTWISIRQQSASPLSANLLLAIGLFFVTVLCSILVYAFAKSQKQEILATWGIFLVVVILTALPQLVGFTFQQASGQQFVRGSFNWANASDTYVIFYLKNIGILFVTTVLILLIGTKKQRQFLFPASILWILCEFILFQPNPYDNNKLLLVAYLFFCIASADFVVDTIPALWQRHQRILRFAGCTTVVILATFAAILTMERERVSDYTLYDKNYVELCQWVEENTDPTDTFLTATNHNNAIASLTGRNIVCGSGSFLYYHGLNYQQQEADTQAMFEDPASRDSLLEKYEVDYIVLGPIEYGTYEISGWDTLYETYSVVYNKDGVVVLAV